jgi:hypothetical protein
MNPTSPTSAMSQGATFMRPGAAGHLARPGPGAAVRGHAAHCGPSGRTGPEDAVRRRHRAQSRRRGQRAVAAAPAQGFPIDVTFPGENEPDQVDAWISAYAEPFYIRA